MKKNLRGFVKKNSFRVLAGISMMFATLNSEARLTLQEIRTASKNVLAVFFTSDTLNLTKVDISNVSEWKINGRPCKSIYRYSTKAGMCDHHIYLQTTDLAEGREYELITPYGSRKFKFDSRTIFCESIKTNQAGYSALSKVRYANFTIWRGTGGSRKIDGPLPAWEVFNLSSGKTITR